MKPPSRVRSVLEVGAVFEPARLIVRVPALGRLERGSGGPVVVVPGFGATDRSTVPLRRFLRSLGHDAMPAGLGRISDDVDATFPRLARMIEDVVDRAGRRVVVVGWSLGGVLAREAARDHQELVARVVTFGTPVVGGPAYTATAWRYSAAQLDAIRQRIDERSGDALRIPITAIWSRRDGVVSPNASFDTISPDVEHVEVRSTHLGMGVDPDVWRVVADRARAATASPDP